MKLKITSEQVEGLKLDAKTLVDISRMLEIDGSFNYMPEILKGIADDIQDALRVEDFGKEVVR